MDQSNWEKGNEDYLAAALAWLRLRLEHAADPPLAPKEQVTMAAERLAATADQVEPAPALVLLRHLLGLSRFEQDVLLLCAAPALDIRIPALCAQLQQGRGPAGPTFALALSLFDDPRWDVLSPERPLRYWQLIEIDQAGATPLTLRALAADERVVNYVKGLNHLDERVAALVTPLEVEDADGALPASQQAVVEKLAGHLRPPSPSDLPAVQLLGSDRQSKRLLAGRAAAACGLHVFRLSVDLLPASPGELDLLARLWHRESRLLPVALYLEGRDRGGAHPAAGDASVLASFLARSDGVFFLDTDAEPPATRPTVAIEVTTPTPVEQRVAWAALTPRDDDLPARLSGQFDLGVAAIRQIARTALGDGLHDGPALASERLWDACLAWTRPRLEGLAQRLDPRATWSDLVLPAAATELLRQIASQVRHRGTVYDDWGFRRKMSRGFGITALFAGDSGTGKTMAAEVIANDLRVALCRIDLSAVVSKYIGETEKNLARVFDAAEGGGVILLFDEADALFGKRSEVKDSHDRYANIEINYLLQRMEAFRGLAVLATNMKRALDSAFLRRLRFIVDFPFPGVRERERIWANVFPAETPTAGLDIHRLARLNLTGGSIHSIGLNAAFLAAQAGAPVTMPLVLQAARLELRKLDRPVNESDFRWQTPAEVVA
jgi:hypothetical protein